MRDEKWHGLTVWQANRYKQGKKCEICSSRKRLVVDHDHETKAIRGVLCNTCNMYVGVVENTTLLRAIIAYLKLHGTKPGKTAVDFERYKKLPGPPPPHGTVARYNYRSAKCRCRKCRDAMRDRDRRINGRKPRPKDWGKPKHGTYAKYQQERKQGLTPCTPCRKANRLRSNTRNQAKAREIKVELNEILKAAR